MYSILFTGGGSAGHVVPNLAIMYELRYSHRVLYMGTGGIEKTLVTEEGYPFFEVDCPKLRRSFSAENLKIPFRLRRAKRAALDILRREKPDLVFSKGGFASYPAVWAASKLGVPVLTHESDLSPGLCTRMIAKKCVFVLTSFPETALRFKNGKYVGSPIHRETLSGERSRARKKYGLSDLPVLLVLGGGSGSKTLNDALRASLPALLPRMQILHLCGKGNLMNDPPKGYIQKEFEKDMGSAYAAADVVLCRAGSNTVFELLALKKPAVLVPLARASRGDQVENAVYFERRGLVKVLREEALNASLKASPLPDAVFSALTDDALHAALASSSFPSATARILPLLHPHPSSPSE